MIRIDLGKDDLKGGTNSGIGSFGGKLGGGLKSKLNFTGLGKLIANMSGLGIVLIFGSASILPHLFFTQYRDTVIKLQEQKVATAQSRVTALGAEIEKLKPYQKELESFEAQKRLVQERLDVIRGLLSSRSTPVNVLDSMGQALPQKAWITAIEFDAKKESSLASISGQAVSNEDVSDFVDKLSESIHLKEVSLDSVTTSKGSGSNMDWRIFNITTIPKGSQQSISTASRSARAVAGVPAPVAPPAAAAKGPAAGLE